MAGSVIQPRIEAGYDGTMVRSWFQYDSGSSGPGKIYIQYRKPGQTSWGSAVAIKQDTTVMAVSDSGYSVSMAYDNAARWLLACVLDGESAIKDFFSTDYLETWKLVV